MSDHTTLQVRLIAEVRSQGVPQTLLAKRAGLTEKHVSQMLTGKVAGTLTAWQALLDATAPVPVAAPDEENP